MKQKKSNKSKIFKKIKKLREKQDKLDEKAMKLCDRSRAIGRKIQELEPPQESFFEHYAGMLRSRPSLFNNPIFGLQIPFRAEPDALDADTLEVDDDKDA